MKMTFSPLENCLLVDVVHKPLPLTSLYAKYVGGSRCSRAGFYKALSSLQKKEVVIEKNRVLSVNKIWLSDSYDFFSKLVQQKTVPSYLANQVAELKEGDRLSYTFHSIAEIDIFLLNLIYDLLLLKVDKHALILEPHEFFVLLNGARTRQILKEVSALGCSINLLIESDSPVDKEITKDSLPKGAVGYVSGKKSTADPKVTHVVGDVCIELKLNKSLASSIDRLFASEARISQQFVNHLRDLVGKKQKNQIIIYRNSKKAQKIRSHFKKYF